MGVRLYPNTQDRGVLEALASVGAGTYDRLDALEASGLGGQALYDALQGDAEVARLHHFLIFGWGKLRPDTWAWLRANVADFAEGNGVLRDVEAAYHVLTACQGGTLGRLPPGRFFATGGVYWC